MKNKLVINKTDTKLKYDYLIHASVPVSEFWGISYPVCNDIQLNFDDLKEMSLNCRGLAISNKKYLSDYKKYNYSLALKEFEAQRGYCFSMPFVLQASRTELCNLSCLFCRPMPIKHFNTMEKVQWQEALELLLPPVVEFLPYCWGEPLLDSCFGLTCELAERYKTPVSIITNFQHFDKKIAEIVLTGVCRLLISVDTSRAETFKTLRKGGSLRKIENNLNLLRMVADKAGMEIPWIGISAVLCKSNLNDLPQLIEWAADRGLLGLSARRMVIRENINKTLIGEGIDLLSDEYRDMHDKATETAKHNNMVLNMPTQIYSKAINSICPCPWTHIYLSPQGNLHLCAFSHGRIVGNIPVRPDYWNSKDITNLRLSFFNKQRCKECASLDSIGSIGASQVRGY